ncbi:hypothetical protein DEO72_LG10g1796 [Vigna unguiculata]|uniref:Uncharacterized protein n=1 Tax=Vigna unguiculata TaxID=3917 RepID=A0A4D6NA00_VIGUN|nr:hypothetical protein DEO72_LG10g1796 [Vigna unguiculata]
MTVAGRNSGKVRHTRPSEPVSPRRDLHYLAHARDARQARTRECSGHVAPVLAQARGCLAQARRTLLSEPYESLPMPLSQSRLSEGPPPKRGHSSRLSEGS